MNKRMHLINIISVFPQKYRARLILILSQEEYRIKN